MTDKHQFVLDVECYRNFFYVLFRHVESGRSKGFANFNDEGLDFDGLGKLLTNPEAEFITFNGNSYDMPMIVLALSGATNAQLKEASDDNITNNLKPWTFYRKYGLHEPDGVNHIDLIEVAPSQCSLKIYGGRMHTQRLQDLPIEPDATLTEAEAKEIKVYCGNDLDVTKELALTLAPQIDLRRSMSETYKVDLRSKSDAQIAEAVLKSEYKREVGTLPPKSNITYNEFQYEPPQYIKFRTANMQGVLARICEAEMKIKDTGHVEMPPEIKNLTVTVGNTTYKMGIGGLHSKESEVTHRSTDTSYVIDRDVVSYYPNLMLNMDMAPASFGAHFKPIYQKILDDRIAAKKQGDMTTSNSLKITLNGTFGKTSNKYSQLYSPKLLLHTTLTGQLSLLMLIEMLEAYDVPVVSANTDGVVFICPAEKYDDVNTIIKAWERRCNLETEETRYSSLHSRDVNNYIAITTGGKVKTKGTYGSAGLMKNPQNEICAEAVIQYLTHNEKIEDTVRNCTDIRKFISLRTVKGGAVKDGYVLGKAIRWYYSTQCRGEEIFYKTNGNTVPRTLGAKPIMDLPEELPDDIDYDWYVTECYEMLMSLGVIQRPVMPPMPRKNSKAWKELRDAGRIKEGRTPKDKWVWV